MFYLSFLFFVFKYDRLIFLLLSIEFIFFSLIVWYVFFLESVLFFYFLCFGVVSSVSGLVVFFLSVLNWGFDKVMF